MKTDVRVKRNSRVKLVMLQTLRKVNKGACICAWDSQADQIWAMLWETQQGLPCHFLASSHELPTPRRTKHYWPFTYSLITILNCGYRRLLNILHSFLERDHPNCCMDRDLDNDVTRKATALSWRCRRSQSPIGRKDRYPWWAPHKPHKWEQKERGLINHYHSCPRLEANGPTWLRTSIPNYGEWQANNAGQIWWPLPVQHYRLLG